ncbi:hypothetical protein [Streptomyces umbrinus]
MKPPLNEADQLSSRLLTAGAPNRFRLSGFSSSFSDARCGALSADLR